MQINVSWEIIIDVKNMTKKKLTNEFMANKSIKFQLCKTVGIANYIIV